jgi:hypothetical protein
MRLPRLGVANEEQLPMRAVDLIRRKRDGGRLSAAEMGWLVGGISTGDVPDYQWAALPSPCCGRRSLSAISLRLRSRAFSPDSDQAH